MEKKRYDIQKIKKLDYTKTKMKTVKCNNVKKRASERKR